MSESIDNECLSYFIQYYIYKIYPYNSYRRVYEENIVDLVLATKPSDVFPPQNTDDCLFKENQFQINFFEQLFNDAYPIEVKGKEVFRSKKFQADKIKEVIQIQNAELDRKDDNWQKFIQDSLESRNDIYLKKEHAKKDKKVEKLKEDLNDQNKMEGLYFDFIFSVFVILSIYYRRNDRGEDGILLINTLKEKKEFNEKCFFWHLQAAFSEIAIKDYDSYREQKKIASIAITNSEKEVKENNNNNQINQPEYELDGINAGVYLNFAMLILRAYEHQIFQIQDEIDAFSKAIEYAKKSFVYRPGYAKFHAIYGILLYDYVLGTEDTLEHEQAKLKDALSNLNKAILFEKKHQNQYISRTAQWEKYRLDIDIILKQMKFNNQKENQINTITTELSNNKRMNIELLSIFSVIITFVTISTQIAIKCNFSFNEFVFLFIIMLCSIFLMIFGILKISNDLTKPKGIIVWHIILMIIGFLAFGAASLFIKRFI